MTSPPRANGASPPTRLVGLPYASPARIDSSRASGRGKWRCFEVGLSCSVSLGKVGLTMLWGASFLQGIADPWPVVLSCGVTLGRQSSNSILISFLSTLNISWGACLLTQYFIWCGAVRLHHELLNTHSIASITR